MVGNSSRNPDQQLPDRTVAPNFLFSRRKLHLGERRPSSGSLLYGSKVRDGDLGRHRPSAKSPLGESGRRCGCGEGVGAGLWVVLAVAVRSNEGGVVHSGSPRGQRR